jgi:hypothetical protein
MADTQKLFSSIEAKYRLPSGYLARVYQLESRGGKDNYNASTKAAGPFQFVPKTAKGMGLDDPYDLEASADAAARLAVQNRAVLQRNGIENPDGKTLYLAHQQGAAGAEKLLKGGDAPATSALGEVYKDPKIAAKAVTGNGGQADMASSAFANKIMAKYEGKETSGDPLRPYGALGETPPIDKAAQESPLATKNTADVLEGPAPSEDDGSSRKQTYAMNALLNAQNALQQQSQTPLLPIPRLSYAEGGIVGLAKRKPVMLTHYSNKPDLKEVDPDYYGTNNPGDDVKRVLGRKDGNPRRSYFYTGKPGDVLPEHKVGKYAYTTTSDKLYDLSEDPLKLYNGSSPAALNRLEHEVRSRGYEGILGKKAAHPTAVLFEKKTVDRHPMDRVDASIAASTSLAKKAIAHFNALSGGDPEKIARELMNLPKADLRPREAKALAMSLANKKLDNVKTLISTHPKLGSGFSKLFAPR